MRSEYQGTMWFDPYINGGVDDRRLGGTIDAW